MGEQGRTIYQGEDRRGLLAADHLSPGSGFVTASAALLVLVAILLVARPAAPGLFDATTLTAQLDAAAFMVALLLAAACLVRWKLVGEASVLWLAAAALVYALSVLGAGYVLTSSLRVNDATVVPFLITGSIVALVAGVCAVIWHPVDTGLAPWRVALRLLVVVPVVELALHLRPGLAESAPVLVIVGWTTLAVVALVRGMRQRRHLLSWFALLFVALAFAELFAATPLAGGVVAELSPSLLRGTGLLLALVGVARELARSYIRQGAQLLESKASELTAEARLEAGLVEQAERAHEATNALAAIEAATITLQRYQDRLPPDSRNELSQAVSAEVRRLQALVAAQPGPNRTGRFRLTEALAALVTCARSQGSTVHLDVPGHLVAFGSPTETAQVLQNLFQNAQRFAGGEVTVRANLDGDNVVIRVMDDGPGVPSEERERIFHRGVRGTNAAGTVGSGLGLYVSARLMREQGGDLRLEEYATGGACFAVILPGFSELAEHVPQDVDERAEFVARGQLYVLPSGQDPGPAAGVV
jgi:signal transduction histidine kinase